MLKKISCLLTFFFIPFFSCAFYMIIPMDNSQKNHLKAYGIAYYAIENNIKVDWLLNYYGGSFMLKQNKQIQEECDLRNVSYNIIADVKSSQILKSISSPEKNQDVIRLEKAPKIAIYSPKNKQPWDDAVTLALSYAEIPYDIIYDEEVLNNILSMYDWLHLHHEDFTGQYGKFYRNYRNAAWYINQQKNAELRANELGFDKVSKLKLEVGKTIKEFVAGGGFLFTMCSGTDSYDISMSAEDTDICEYMFDGDGTDPNAQAKLNFNNTLAFKDFKLKV